MWKKYPVKTSLDDPQTTLIHREIILNKPCLKKIYEEWYAFFLDWYRMYPQEIHLEIGSGGGFLKDIFPGVITSDILPLPGIDQVINAEQLPFDNNSLFSISMVNVFHHIPRPWKFLKEAQRCLKKGGRIMMIEPSATLAARIVYKYFHHEPFHMRGPREIESGRPLSNSNQAMTYIYFIRDKAWFEETFPDLKILINKNLHPFRYLLSGGVSRTSLFPDRVVNFFEKMEKRMGVFNDYLGLFHLVIIEKIK